MSQFLDQLKAFASEIDNHLHNLINEKISIENELKESILYSSVGSGKRIKVIYPGRLLTFLALIGLMHLS